MRRAFSDTLVEIADSHPELMFLTGDLGFEVFTELEAKHPDKYINAGIAESQLATCAAGLALSGFRPVIYSIASFMTGRAFELIRTSINYQKLPVLIIGAGGGYIYSSSGVTHHAAEDLGLMRLMPGMVVMNPGSPSEVRALMWQFFRQDSPAYMRIGRFGEPEYGAIDADIILGQARRVRNGAKIALLSTGDTVITCAEALDQLSADGIHLTHIQYHTLAPFDGETLDVVFDTHDHVVVIEDHFPVGGLYSLVCESKVNHPAAVKLHRIGPKHELVLGSPSLKTLRHHYGYDTESVVTFCRQLLDR